MWIGSHIRSINFFFVNDWPWSTANPGFKVTVQNGAFYCTSADNSFTYLTSSVMVWLLRSLGDSWASCHHSHCMIQCTKFHHNRIIFHCKIIRYIPMWLLLAVAILDLWCRHNTASGNQLSWSQHSPKFPRCLVWWFPYKPVVSLATDRQTDTQAAKHHHRFLHRVAAA